MSKLMTWILTEQENGRDLLEMQEQMRILAGEWEKDVDNDQEYIKQAEERVSDEH